MNKPITAVLLALLVVAGPVSATDIYKWQDTEGRVHYGSNPPNDVKAVKVSVGNTSSARGEDSAGSDGGYTSEQAQQPAASEQQASNKRSGESEDCRIARNNLELLQDDGVTRFRDEEGNIVKYDADQREGMVEQAKAQVEHFCRD